ncbi:Sporulation protein RMD1 [Golovinomyces cichoracearum]|uniref:Sporulation protein RMD1 n=1 Tax=Golovinomyces cichoracearum TaxID=62708 RepID=A0A420HN26_9PEZI|nr:Sporulation protein RMD1 [Golovinomyces cichoracearum]
MASTVAEMSPLLDSPNTKASPRLSRNVTFMQEPGVGLLDGKVLSVQNPVSTASASPLRSTRFSLISRRRTYDFTNVDYSSSSAVKIGPQRTTKNVQKLKLLPNPDLSENRQCEEENGREVYSQYTRIKDPNARRDAARLGKADRDRLPRVTAYCTANKYKIENMMRFLKGRGKTRGASPKLVDECIYTPFRYDSPDKSSDSSEITAKSESIRERRYSDSYVEANNRDRTRRQNLINLHTERDTMRNEIDRNQTETETKNDNQDSTTSERNPDFDTEVHIPEIFLFNYGVVVIWGMSLQHEQRFLKEIARFESEKLDPDDMETECFNFYYTQEYQAQIYNDFITLRDKKSYMTKLAISHALAQSVKTSLFEGLVDNTIEACKDIPGQIATTGKIALTRTQINMQIGELFILRINIHLNGSVLDTPEIFWLQPHLEPVYQAVRSYLEIDQRVTLLTGRLGVIADLLAVLKDQLSHRHGEMLEWIVIFLIAAEILVAAINIIVDLNSGVY